MCTLTLLPESQGYTLTMNRDELRSRAEAGLHQRREGAVAASFPVDAVAGGTWVGVNDQGVSLALLNGYQAPSIKDARSRGSIIASAIFKRSGNDILEFLKALDVHYSNPFSLIVVSGHQVSQFHWDRQSYRWSTQVLHQPMMLTSSSERFEQVLSYRQARFCSWLAERSGSNDVDRFHLSQQPGKASDSVRMSRERAHTKSTVQIRVGAETASLDYFDTQYLDENRTLSQPATQSKLFSLKSQTPVLVEDIC